jgi:hypothetical protein
VWNERTTLPRGIGLRFGGTQREYRAHHCVGVGQVPAGTRDARRRRCSRLGALCGVSAASARKPGLAACHSKIASRPASISGDWIAGTYTATSGSMADRNSAGCNSVSLMGEVILAGLRIDVRFCGWDRQLAH